MPSVLDDLRDLHKQATTEHSHYYVAKTTGRAIEEIERLRAGMRALVSAIANDETNTVVLSSRAYAEAQHLCC